MAHWIGENCIGCGACARACPVHAIEGAMKQRHAINARRCVDCGVCGMSCPVVAVHDASGAVCRRVPQKERKKPIYLLPKEVRNTPGRSRRRSWTQSSGLPLRMRAMNPIRRAYHLAKVPPRTMRPTWIRKWIARRKKRTNRGLPQAARWPRVFNSNRSAKPTAP